MRRGRRLPELKLSEEHRSTLQGWTRRRKSAQALSMRARIVLRASDGLTATAIAAEVHACIQTVSKYPPAEPEALRLLAPQRGLIATGEKQKQPQQQK